MSEKRLYSSLLLMRIEEEEPFRLFFYRGKNKEKKKEKGFAKRYRAGGGIICQHHWAKMGKKRGRRSRRFSSRSLREK